MCVLPEQRACGVINERSVALGGAGFYTSDPTSIHKSGLAQLDRVNTYPQLASSLAKYVQDTSNLLYLHVRH